MPISGVVIRCALGVPTSEMSARLARISGLELGTCAPTGVAGVIDAPDYASHDAVLSALRDSEGVCAVDVVFHDFSDVNQFDRLPKQPRGQR